MTEQAKPVVLRIRLPFQSEAEFVTRYGHHLTAHGIFIATRSLKAPGASVGFELVLQDGGRLLRGEARVKSVIEDPTPGKAGMQLTFVRLDEPSLSLLRRAIPAPAPSPAKPVLLPRVPPPPPRPHGWAIDLSDAVLHAAVFDTAGAREGLQQLEVPALAVPSPEGPGGVRVGAAAERLLQSTGAVPIDVLQRLGHPASGLEPPPVELASMLLAEVREQLVPLVGALSPRLALAVPAHWSARQRSAAVDAAAALGLTARLVNASTAAALALTQGRQLARKRLLVVATGSTACEAAVVEVTGDDLEVAAVVSSVEAGLGGVVERLVAKDSVPFEELSRRRRLLRERVPGAGPDTPVELASGGTGWPWPALAEVLGQASAAAAGLLPSYLDEALLVGPLAASAWFREPLERSLGRPVLAKADPGTLATGAAIAAWYEVARSLGRPAGRVAEPLSTAVGLARRDGTMSRIFEPHTRLPTEKALAFPTVEGTPFAVTLWQGNGAMAESSAWLGGIASVAERTGELVLRVRLTSDGRLDARLETPTGRLLEVRLSAAEPTAAERAVLVERSPWQAATPEAQGLLTKMKKFFGSS